MTSYFLSFEHWQLNNLIDPRKRKSLRINELSLGVCNEYQERTVIRVYWWFSQFLSISLPILSFLLILSYFYSLSTVLYDHIIIKSSDGKMMQFSG